MKQAAKTKSQTGATTETPTAENDREGASFTPQLDWVVSYPKSGNTWTRLISRVYSHGKPSLQGLGRAGDLNINNYHNVSPLPIKQIGIGAEIQLRPAAMLDLAVDLHPKTHLIKSHHACISYQGIDLWHPRWTRTVLYVVRDPRDVACSLADHMSLSHKEAVEFMGEDQIIGPAEELHHILTTWSKHVRSWLQAEEESPWKVHVMRYEDMQSDPIDTFGAALEAVLGRPPESDRLKNAVEVCDFDNLQRIEEEHGFPEQSENHDRFFRKGEAEGWRDELDQSLAQKIKEDHGEVMQQLGYL